ncbi:MAG: PAS domain S-box protein [Pedobacter sp.]|uniref:PAS domain S-box protein n=1 Tax=Pedobacter sp. TaxID=1411316 RepID=UPI0028086CCE|nr:PAS domain S-box protein [Pedobacter sp.]MDQ8005169.1 PAS domain S-box protein [Pedobacter sp.]
MPKTAKQPAQTNWFILHPKLSAFLFFVVLISIISLIAQQRYLIIKENREKEIDVMLESVELRLEQLLKNSQNITLTLALTLDQTGKPRNFDAVAAQIIKGNPYLQAVQLVPGGVIKYTYPLEGNEQALGLDLLKLSDVNAAAAKKAIATRKIYFQGPVKLVQGGEGVIGRLPIYIDNEFWGFSAVVVKLGELLKAAGIDNTNQEYYKFQFSKVNQLTGVEEYFLPGQINFTNTYKSKVFEEGDWKIYLTDTRPIYADYQLGSLAIFGVLVSILSAYLLLRLLNKQAQLYATLDRQAEMLLTAESKYKTIFDHAAIGIGRVNSITGEFLETNAFLCNLLGYTSAELTHKKIKTLIHADDLAADAHSFKRLLSGEIKQFSSVRRYINKEGEVIWANAIVSPLWNEGEPPNNHIIIIDDITQQVAYEEQLIASQKHIEELVNSIEGIVWETSVTDNFVNTFVSSKVYDILGYTPEEWSSEIGFFFNKLYHEDSDKIKTYLDNELFLRKHHEYEYRMVAKNGSIIWIRDSVNVVPNLEAPEKLRGIMMDITRIKEAEETLHKSYELVNEQNKRLLNFSYIVSHNLRSHASNIDGISALISNADTNEERDEMIKLMRKVVVNLNDTLYNLNSIVNIQTSINMVKEPLNLLAYVNNAIQTQEAQILSKNAKLIINLTDDVFVYFNKAYLESVLLNLISNALRYSHALRRPLIEINCEPIGGGYIFSIKDNGVGIDLAKNGDKMFGLNQTFHGNSDARGFGLFITKNQIEAMGYTIEVESTLGEGTTFKILFT